MESVQTSVGPDLDQSLCMELVKWLDHRRVYSRWVSQGHSGCSAGKPLAAAGQ